MGLGVFYTKADSMALAYQKLYESFQDDNSLIVRAEYTYGFEIRTGHRFSQDFPEMPEAKVTYYKNPVKFAKTDLFEFENNTKKKK